MLLKKVEDRFEAERCVLETVYTHIYDFFEDYFKNTSKSFLRHSCLPALSTFHIPPPHPHMYFPSSRLLPEGGISVVYD